MPNIPIADDIFKQVMKLLANKGNQKARYELMQKTKNIVTTGSSYISSKPKPKVKPKPKPTVSGKPVGRIAATPPARPRRDYYPKGKTVPQTASEMRAAERQANRLLRQAGLIPKHQPPTRGGKPVDVRGSIIQPPSKATQRPPKPSNSSFEADPMRRARGEDKAAGLTRGKPQPKGKPKPKNK